MVVLVKFELIFTFLASVSACFGLSVYIFLFFSFLISVFVFFVDTFPPPTHTHLVRMLRCVPVPGLLYIHSPLRFLFYSYYVILSCMCWRSIATTAAIMIGIG
eukprot:Rmarinus@m.15955